ncbi:MAG: hypothetical protein AAGJ74_02205 [Pseudomonadota bacterium]
MNNATSPTPKPVIALMGEFSAGKSTLANLLICEGRSPTQVTATQLPPVWYSYGSGDPYVMGLDGRRTPISEAEMADVVIDSTSYIKVFLEADILELFDIMDMPGNSDPNMSPEVWQRAIHHADGVIWCSHATQAWRQSEAGAWEELPARLREWSLLLLTRWDKILSERDRARVLARVEKEAGPLFRDVFPISLVEALDSGDDRDRWVASGADAFVTALLDIIMSLDGQARAQNAAPGPVAQRPLYKLNQDPPETPDMLPKTVAPLETPQPAAATSGASVIPRRVEAKAESQRPRPPRGNAPNSQLSN